MSDTADSINKLIGVDLTEMIPGRFIFHSGSGSGKLAVVQTIACCLLRYGSVARLGSNILNHAFVVGAGSGFLLHATNCGMDLRAHGIFRGDVRFGFYHREVVYWEESILQFTAEELEVLDIRFAVCGGSLAGCIVQNVTPRDGDKCHIDDVITFLRKRSADWIIVDLKDGQSFLVAAYQRDSDQISVIRSQLAVVSPDASTSVSGKHVVVYITDTDALNNNVQDFLLGLSEKGCKSLSCYAPLPTLPDSLSSFAADCVCIQQHNNNTVVPNVQSGIVYMIGNDDGLVGNIFLMSGVTVYRL